MTLLVKNAGVWTTAKDLHLRNGTAWTEVKEGYVRDGGTWKLFHTAEIVVTLAAANRMVTLKNLFSAADWTSDKRKRVIIPSGVEIGDGGRNNSALWTGCDDNGTGGWGGDLIVENNGVISGRGGAANSGEGGVALWPTLGAAKQKLIILNNGTIRGGGGGGGKGGTGGGGYYDTTTREPSSGFNDVLNQWQWHIPGNTNFQNFARAYWNSTLAASGGDKTVTSLVGSDGWTYLRGSLSGSVGTGSSSLLTYTIARTRTTRTNTNGGAGGNGGRGQGYDAARAAGATGAAGGTNAGRGGTGATGGLYGAAGGKGSTGANGNRTNGTAGANGGAAGYAIRLASTYALLTNAGTLQGRT